MGRPTNDPDRLLDNVVVQLVQALRDSLSTCAAQFSTCQPNSLPPFTYRHLSSPHNWNLEELLLGMEDQHRDSQSRSLLDTWVHCTMLAAATIPSSHRNPVHHSDSSPPTNPTRSFESSSATPHLVAHLPDSPRPSSPLPLDMSFFHIPLMVRRSAWRLAQQASTSPTISSPPVSSIDADVSDPEAHYQIAHRHVMYSDSELLDFTVGNSSISRLEAPIPMGSQDFPHFSFEMRSDRSHFLDGQSSAPFSDLGDRVGNVAPYAHGVGHRVENVASDAEGSQPVATGEDSSRIEAFVEHASRARANRRRAYRSSSV